MAGSVAHDMMWDEDRPTAGPRDKKNLLSVPEMGEFFLSTRKAIDWRACGRHDTGRQVTPSVFVEGLLRRARVQDLEVFALLMFLDFCLHTGNFMCPALPPTHG